MRQLRPYLPLLILVAIGILAWVFGVLDALSPARIVRQHAELTQQIAESPWRFYLIYVVVLTVLFATGIPGPLVVIITGGLLFGLWVGSALSLLSMVAGSLVLFFAAIHAFRTGRKSAPELVDRLRKGYEANPVSYTAFLRLVPLFPFGGVTAALAWFRCPLWLFVTATTLGGLTMVVVESAIGAGLAQSLGEGEEFSFNLLAEPHIWVPLVLLGLLALTPVVIQKMRGRKAHADAA